MSDGLPKVRYRAGAKIDLHRTCLHESKKQPILTGPAAVLWCLTTDIETSYYSA